ncbi:MAG: peptidoglycan-binding protein, partial [Micropepsaceae bacterium]
PKRIPIGGGSEPDEKQIARASHYARLEFDGSPFARHVGSGIPLSIEESLRVPSQIVRDSLHDGVLGFYRLGLVSLGEDSFEIAKADRKVNAAKGLYVPFCKDAKFKRASNWKDSYYYFAMAEICQTSVPNAPNARQWMKAIKERNPGQDAEFSKLEADAAEEFIELILALGWDPDNASAKRDFCLGLQNTPTPPPRCGSAKTALQALNLGKAFFADGKQDEARACYNDAIELAKTDPSGPEPGFQAQRALQSMASSCKWNRDSLAAINRDYNARSVDLIRVETLQQALRALNHYDGLIDGQLSPATRASIRKFQREQGDDETDILSPLQITQLICSAAETEDLASQTALGVMYILGDGVIQNIDSAQQWLIRAANRHYPDASYNLAMLYGTGIVLDSYRLCDVPRTPEQADRYLAEAADAHGYTPAPGAPPCKGQLLAQKLMGVFGPGSKYSALPASDRWMLIERQALDKIRSGPFGDRLQNIGKKCPQPITPEP